MLAFFQVESKSVLFLVWLLFLTFFFSRGFLWIWLRVEPIFLNFSVLSSSDTDFTHRQCIFKFFLLAEDVNNVFNIPIICFFLKISLHWFLTTSRWWRCCGCNLLLTIGWVRRFIAIRPFLLIWLCQWTSRCGSSSIISRLRLNLLWLLLRWFNLLFFASVSEALLLAIVLVLAHFHDQLDIVLHDHVQKIHDCVRFWRTRGYQKLLLKTGVDPGCVDIVIVSVICKLVNGCCLSIKIASLIFWKCQTGGSIAEHLENRQRIIRRCFLVGLARTQSLQS